MADQRQTEIDDGLEYVRFFNSNHKMLIGYECRTCYAIVPYPTCPHHCRQDDPGFEDMAMTVFLRQMQRYDQQGLFHLVRAEHHWTK